MPTLNDIEISTIEESADGWDVTYWNVNREEWDIFEVNFYEFRQWLADYMFCGSLTKAQNYIWAEPTWTKDHLRTYFLGKLKVKQ